MKKYKAAVAATLMFAAGAANAISMDVEAGKKFTDINVGLGDPYSGLSFDGNWARSDHQGQLGGARAKFAFPLGPVSASVGGKAVYIDPEVGKKGMAVAPGVGVAWSILPSVRVYGEFYGAPSGLTSGNDSYKEADVGANWTVFAPLNVKAGYRKIEVESNSGHENRIADGAYLGAGLSF
ncbi:TPA: porin [Morganella morganii subsp. morganii]|nr:porin [Morganella morganii subsp. morganii]